MLIIKFNYALNNNISSNNYYFSDYQLIITNEKDCPKDSL